MFNFLREGFLFVSAKCYFLNGLKGKDQIVIDIECLCFENSYGNKKSQGRKIRDEI